MEFTSLNFGVQEILILMVIGLLFAFWLWMLVDCLKNQALQGTEKIVWVLVIIFLHALGALVYFFVGRSKRT
jgi:uncharacterized membrane protein YczE